MRVAVVVKRSAYRLHVEEGADALVVVGLEVGPGIRTNAGKILV